MIPASPYESASKSQIATADRDNRSHKQNIFEPKITSFAFIDDVVVVVANAVSPERSCPYYFLLVVFLLSVLLLLLFSSHVFLSLLIILVIIIDIIFLLHIKCLLVITIVMFPFYCYSYCS